MINEAELSETILERVANVLLVLANVGSGDYSSRLDSDLPGDHPISLLYEGINEMVSSLETAHGQSAGYQRELEEKIEMIDVQRAAIKELSTPIIEVWDGILCLPVVGVLDTGRSAEMTNSLLSAVVAKEAKCAIIDITGIQIMDTGTADHFLRIARAIRLLGADCILTGVNPSIAQTIVHMGIDLNGAVTYRTLRDALKRFLGSGRQTS